MDDKEYQEWLNRPKPKYKSGDEILKAIKEEGLEDASIYSYYAGRPCAIEKRPNGPQGLPL